MIRQANSCYEKPIIERLAKDQRGTFRIPQVHGTQAQHRIARLLLHLRLHAITQQVKRLADFLGVAGKICSHILQRVLEAVSTHEVLKCRVVEFRQNDLIQIVSLPCGFEFSDRLAQGILHTRHATL